MPKDACVSEIVRSSVERSSAMVESVSETVKKSNYRPGQISLEPRRFAGGTTHGIPGPSQEGDQEEGPLSRSEQSQEGDRVAQSGALWWCQGGDWVVTHRGDQGGTRRDETGNSAQVKGELNFGQGTRRPFIPCSAADRLVFSSPGAASGGKMRARFRVSRLSRPPASQLLTASAGSWWGGSGRGGRSSGAGRLGDFRAKSLDCRQIGTLLFSCSSSYSWYWYEY